MTGALITLQQLMSGEAPSLTVRLFLNGDVVAEQADLKAWVKIIKRDPNSLRVAVTMTFRKKTTYDHVTITGDGVSFSQYTLGGRQTGYPDCTLTVEQYVWLSAEAKEEQP